MYFCDSDYKTTNPLEKKRQKIGGELFFPSIPALETVIGP